MFVFAGAEELQVQANRFEVSTVKLRRKMWWKNLKVIWILGDGTLSYVQFWNLVGISTLVTEALKFYILFPRLFPQYLISWRKGDIPITEIVILFPMKAPENKAIYKPKIYALLEC